MSKVIAIATALCLVAGLLTARVESQQVIDSAGDLIAAAPADNPSTAAKVALGRLLFWDPILSGPRDVACATCHHPAFGYSDGLPRSIGVNGTGLGARRQFEASGEARFAKRNSQTVLNVAFVGVTDHLAYDAAQAPMFWDTRVRGLEAQALEPIKSAEEMRGAAYPEVEAVDRVMERLRAIPEYVSLFASAFGPDGATEGNLARALAAFERTLVALDAPFDRYQRGEPEAMTPLQIAGMREFERVGCVRCHSGPLFSDFKLHVLAAPDDPAALQADGGAQGTYAFRTPSLRNLRYTAPYMHSGVFQTLDDVVRFYGRNRGGGRRGAAGDPRVPAPARAQLDPLFLDLRRVGRSRPELVAFLEALNSESFDRTIPANVPSGLHPGGGIE
jgi:cytochrome c peroxidase